MIWIPPSPGGGDNRVHATRKELATPCCAATPVIIPHITQQECGHRSLEWARAPSKSDSRQSNSRIRHVEPQQRRSPQVQEPVSTAARIGRLSTLTEPCMPAERRLTTAKSGAIVTGVAWGCSLVGRAPRSQCGGQGFESPQLHHRLTLYGFGALAQLGERNTGSV